jgi:acetyltransferase-like isoleucine patch superfamily enzyme
MQLPLGAVVLKDSPKYGTACGNPAKVFKYRNIKHYNKLKENKQFH